MKGNRKLMCGLVLSGVVLCGGIILVIVGPIVIKQQIIKNMKLVKGTQGYEVWADQRDQPVYMQFWVFDLQNEEEVMRGGKPYVVQRGPYTYREYRWKTDIVHNANGTVTYRQMKNYRYLPHMSPDGDEQTLVTTPNIVLMTIVEGLRYEPDLVQAAASLGLILTEETLFLRKSVYDVIWGFHDPLLNMSGKLAPGWFDDDISGVMRHKNDTYDGLYTVYTGETDYNLTGVIDRFNGSRALPYWTSGTANMINGSDGTVAPPYYAVDKTHILATFVSDVCRSMYGLYSGTLLTPQGISLNVYTGPDDLMDNVTVRPDNAGFCTPPGTCLPSGLMNLSTCQIEDGFHIPVVLSLPHFFLADPSVQRKIDGLRPDRRQHTTIVAVEPYTGLVMTAYKRMQINLYIRQAKDIPQTANVTDMFVPILWLNESVVVNDANADKFKRMLLIPQQVVYVTQYVLISLGGAGVLLFGFLLIRARRKEVVGEASDGSAETDPLLH